MSLINNCDAVTLSKETVVVFFTHSAFIIHDVAKKNPDMAESSALRA